MVKLLRMFSQRRSTKAIAAYPSFSNLPSKRNLGRQDMMAAGGLGLPGISCSNVFTILLPHTLQAKIRFLKNSPKFSRAQTQMTELS